MESVSIIAELKNPADYEGYKAVCAERGLFAFPLITYMNMLGAMLIGMHKYPDLPPYEAFMKIQQEANQAMGQSTQTQSGQPVKPGCGTCGGGAVV